MLRKPVTVKKIQALDRIAIEKYRISSLFLMENAGRGVAKEVLKLLKRKKNPCVCIFCGVGNNAGDGFVAARYLIESEVTIKVFMIGKVNDLKEDALANYFILKKLNCFMREISGVTVSVKKEMERADLIVDAIFGVGLNRKILDPFKGIIEEINSQKKNVVSVDIPSGLDGTTGKIYGVCVKARKTVTFSLAKKGFFVNQGPQFTGGIKIVDIGIPKYLIDGSLQ